MYQLFLIANDWILAKYINSFCNGTLCIVWRRIVFLSSWCIFLRLKMHRALSAIITNPQPNHPRYLTKYPPVLFESRCSINPSFTRMAKCLPIAATLLPDISAIPLRWMPGFKRIIVYVALTLSFSVSFIVSFIVSLVSLFLLLGTGSTNSLSISSYITNYSPYDFSPHGIQISRPLLLCPIR